MNALLSLPAMVLLSDETGPLASFFADVRHLTDDVILQMAKTLCLTRDFTTVLTMGWVENPRDFNRSGPVFRITVPGTHEVATPKPKTRAATKPPRMVDVEADDISDWRKDPGLRGIVVREQLRGARRQSGNPAPFGTASAELVATCCGIAHTRGTFDELPLVDASEVTEGSTVIFTAQRKCRCGRVLVVVTKRLKGEQ